jgi:hypothetical protein
VAFPLVLLMGWVSSPPYFCAHTETVADVANECIMQGAQPPPHQLDHITDTVLQSELMPGPPKTPAVTPVLPPIMTLQPGQQPLGRFEVYIDDFAGIAQGGAK